MKQKEKILLKREKRKKKEKFFFQGVSQLLKQSDWAQIQDFK